MRVQQRTAELAQANELLKAEIAERKRAEDALRQAHDELEVRVRERTADLAEANKALQAEIAEHKRAQQEIKRLNEGLERRVTERTAEVEIVCVLRLARPPRPP